MSEPFTDKICRMSQKDLNDLSAAVSEAIEKIDVIIGSAYCDRNLHDKLWDIRLVLMEALPSTKTSDELAGRKKPRFNEGTKVTLTLKQLRRLVRESGLSDRVRESYQDDVDKSVYGTWLAFINKFGAEETAKLLAYRDSVGRSVIKVEDMIAKYAEDEEGTSTEEVIYPLYEKAKSVGLSTDAAQLYSDYVFTKYDKFLYDTLGDQDYLGYACKYWVEDEVLKALEGRELVYLLVFEGADEQDKDDLPWNDALDALKAKFDVAAEGTTKNEGYQYAVLVGKNGSAVKESTGDSDDGKIPDYKSWHKVVGRGVRSWNEGDVEKPTGDFVRPIMYFKEETPEILDAIKEINRKVPRVGGRIDPWSYAKDFFISLGDTVIETVKGNDVVFIDYGVSSNENETPRHFRKDIRTGEVCRMFGPYSEA